MHLTGVAGLHPTLGLLPPGTLQASSTPHIVESPQAEPLIEAAMDSAMGIVSTLSAALQGMLVTMPVTMPVMMPVMMPVAGDACDLPGYGPRVSNAMLCVDDRHAGDRYYAAPL